MDEITGDNALPKAGQKNDELVESCSTISINTQTDVPSPENPKNLHTDLWNKFLKTISKQHHESQRKYPNPDVPEFYPRGTSYFNACANSLEQTSQCIAYNTNVVPKNDLVLTKLSQQCFADVELKNIVEPNRETVHAVTHYYWTFRDPSYHRVPRVIAYKPAPIPIECDKGESYKSADDLQNEVDKKDKQLAHLNNVVKALLEEIWRVNESLLKHKNKEQWKNDMTFAINEFLKPSSESGFHCDDCCDKFKEFVIKVFKQQERKIAKQHTHYKSTFVDYMITVIENSLESLSKSAVIKEEFKSKLAKCEIGTQTDEATRTIDEQKRMQKRPDTRKSKQQMTKIYRNRNFYKVHDTQRNANFDSNWYHYQQTVPYINPTERSRNKLTKHFQSNVYSPPAYKSTVQPYSFESQTTNPIQLIHQKYKNLNCRLEGIPDKNLVKFSYIVNGKEYSAIASTKKEAQYHCAWHVLGATKQQ